jgi:hypothetical protein
VVGERVIALYREIESQASSSASSPFQALGILARREYIPA